MPQLNAEAKLDEAEDVPSAPPVSVS
jgi:hypothetical protein